MSKTTEASKEYLRNVVDNWTEFCRQHRALEKAITDLLGYTEDLETRNLMLAKIVTSEMRNAIRKGDKK